MVDKWLKERFDLYANHLSMFPKVKIEYPDKNGVLQPQNVRDFFLCPLCLRPYHRSCLELPKNHPYRLTAEHVPPKELGGRKMTLTCRQCNTTFGGKIDAELIKSIKLQKVWPGRAWVEGHEVGIRFHDQGDEVKLEIEPKWSHPVQRERFWESLRAKAKQKQKVEIRVQVFQPYKDTRRRAALFKSAYLLLFHYFGYCYAIPYYNPALVEVMRFVIDPDRHPRFGYNAIQTLRELPEDLPPYGVFLIREPREHASYAVVFRLEWNGKVEQVMVHMPVPGEGLPQVFEEENPRPEEHLELKGCRFDLDFLDSGGVLKDPEMILYAGQVAHHHS